MATLRGPLPIGDNTVQLLFQAKTWIPRRMAKYGPYSRIRFFIRQPGVLLVSHTANDWLYHCPDLDTGNTFAKALIGDGIFTQNGQAHREARKLITPAFAMSQFAWHIQKAQEATDWAFAQQVRGRDLWPAQGMVDFYPRVKEWAFRYACQINFSGDVTNYQGMLQTWLAMQQGIGNLNPFSLSRALRARNRLNRYFQGIIAERRRKLTRGESFDDILARLLNSPLADEAILYHLQNLTFAGFATMSSRAAFLLQSVYSGPNWEIPIAFAAGLRGQSADPNFLTAPGIFEDYLEEVNRLFPVNHVAFKRANRDTQFGDIAISKGWYVVGAPLITNYDPDIFPDPMMFNPARYTVRPADSPDPRAYLHPYGDGHRLCVGFATAPLALKVFFARLLERYETLKVCDEHVRVAYHPEPQPATPVRLSVTTKGTVHG